jgi:hypothetical protein
MYSLWATIVATLLIGYLDSFGGVSCLTAGSASSSQSCLYWARALLNSLSDILYYMRVNTKRNSSLGNDNLLSVGRKLTSGRRFSESKWLIFKSKWPWIKKIVFWYGVWDSPQICKFVSNLPIEIKSQKSKLSLRFAFTFVMRMSWLAMAQLCSVTQSSDNGLDCLGQWLASNNGLAPVNRWV